MQRNKEMNKPLRVIMDILIGLELILTILMVTKLAVMKIAPVLYLVGFVGVMLLLMVGTWFARRKKAPAIVMGIVSLFVIGGLLYGYMALRKVDKTLSNVASDKRLETVEMSIVVRNDDVAAGLEDIKGYQVGVIKADDAAEDVEKKISDAGVQVTYQEYENALFMADALLHQSIDAVIMNNAYVDVIASQDGYEEFSKQVKVIYTLEVEVEQTTTQEEPEAYELSSDENTMVIYISGIDTWGGVQVKSRSDVNILAIVNTKTGKVRLINTPRDYFVTLPQFGAKDKLTHAGLYGVECSESVLESLYGVKIDYYVRMNFSGFEAIINALDGVDVYSAFDFTVDPIKHYTVGYNHVTGLEALAFARERHAFANGDLQRGLNQMEVIRAVIHKMTSFTMLTNYSNVFDAVADCVQTDMPTDVVYDLVRYQLSHNISWTVDSHTVTGTGSHETTFSMPGTTCYVMFPNESDVDEAKSMIQEVLAE